MESPNDFLAFVNQFKYICDNVNTDWIVYLEPDVEIKRPIYSFPTHGYSVGGHMHDFNTFTEKARDLIDSYTQLFGVSKPSSYIYSCAGGNIIRMNDLKNVMPSQNDWTAMTKRFIDLDIDGGADIYISTLFLSCGFKFTEWEGYAEPHVCRDQTRIDNASIWHGSKEHYTEYDPMMSTHATRIQFVDFWDTFDSQSNWFTKLLDYHGYRYVIVHDHPDVVIFSVFGSFRFGDSNEIMCSSKNDKSVRKVFYTGENHDPVKNTHLNITFSNSGDHDNIRLPLWILYGYDQRMTLTKKPTREFCSFVYSNDIPHRNEFCKKLSEYKRVDCGGDCLNNVGGKVTDKIEFQKKYKFCIAYENSVSPGYTTEKILEAYKSNSIPIYYGSSTVMDDFNPETFVNTHDFDTDEDLIAYIQKVDTDDKLYNTFMNKPIFSERWLDIFNDNEQRFFKSIAQQIIGE